MQNKEIDDEALIVEELNRLKNEVNYIENRLLNFDEDLYLLRNKRKLLNHKIADLEYELKNNNKEGC